MDGRTVADRTDVGRPLLVTVLVLLVVAWGCLRGAFALYGAGLRGHAEGDVLGALVLPPWAELGWMVVLLGGLAAVVFTSGWGRRLVGLLLVAGLAVIPLYTSVVDASIEAVAWDTDQAGDPGYWDRMYAFHHTAETLGALGSVLLLTAVLLLVVLGQHTTSFVPRAVDTPPRPRGVPPERAALRFVWAALFVASAAGWLLVPIQMTLGWDGGVTHVWLVVVGLVVPWVVRYTRGPFRRLLGALLVLGVVLSPLLLLFVGSQASLGWMSEKPDWYWTALQLRPWFFSVMVMGLLAAGVVLLAVGHRLPSRLRDTGRG
ncbi:MAG TPA: hypothetical protein VIL00_08930 [Pseudonocardiaceae bacterium]